MWISWQQHTLTNLFTHDSPANKHSSAIEEFNLVLNILGVDVTCVRADVAAQQPWPGESLSTGGAHTGQSV